MDSKLPYYPFLLFLRGEKNFADSDIGEEKFHFC